MAAGCAGTFEVVAGRASAGARAGAVQVLAPEQEFDGVVAGGNVGFRPPQLVQAGEFLGGDFLHIDLVFTHLNLGVGDDVGGSARVAQRVLVVLGYIVDQAFVQGPGVNLSFPVVDDGVAEAEDFALHVRHARSDPRITSSFQGFVIGLGQKRVDGRAQFFRSAFGIVEYRRHHVGVVGDDSLGSRVVGLGSRGRGRRGCRRSRSRSGRGSSRCWRGSLVLAFAATSERDSDGQQTSGCQRHTNHDGILHR
ncbi:hypothetical protein ALP75_201179 [Pseudomonas syringae pv. actinidiae]|nr:hypothetical protein ALP75_201179 [Pseudomonas syringae pv. actinidiae]